MREAIAVVLLLAACYALQRQDWRILAMLTAIFTVVALVWTLLNFSFAALEKHSALGGLLPNRIRIGNYTVSVSNAVASGLVILAVFLGSGYGIGYAWK